MYVGHVGQMKEVQLYINTRRYDVFRLSVQSEYNIEYHYCPNVKSNKFNWLSMAHSLSL
jgi:hypothetical protein